MTASRRPTFSSPPDAPTASARNAPSVRAWLLLAVALSALYAIPFALRGWIPHDEGTIAQSAERVLQGQVPHRDFDEGYTGGLSYVHAAAFRLFGVRLASLRWLLYGGFLIFLAAVFRLALRLGPPWLAFGLTLAAAVWSVPNYFASMPSWYNLFLATFAALALTRWIETSRPRWTLLAGLCAGASVLVKQVGLYAVAAGLLFVVYRERQESSRKPASGRSVLFLTVKTLGAAAFAVLLLRIFGRRRELMDIVEFVLPGALLAGFLVVDEARHGRGSAADRFRGLARAAGPYLAGVALPLALFGAAFAASRSLEPLFTDVFVHSLDAARTAESVPLAPSVLAPALLYALLLAFPTIVPARREKRIAAVLGLVLALAVALAGQPDVYQTIWRAARSLPLVISVVAVAFLARPAGSETERANVFLLAAMAALVSLVQFPFPSPIYFCYVAPLALLGAAALVRADARSPRRIHGVILIFFVTFAAVWMNRGYVFELGRAFSPYVARTPLGLPRAGIRVPAADAREYETLVRNLESRAPGGAIYAGPDCPEVYFLAGRRNPTRSFFDYQGDLYGRPDALLRLLDEGGVSAVVLDRAPAFSRPFEAGFVAQLHARFPGFEDIGRFTLFWRPAPAAAPVYNPQPR